MLKSKLLRKKTRIILKTINITVDDILKIKRRNYIVYIK